MTKLSFAYVMNTAVVLYAVNADPIHWYRAGGLVPDVFMTILVNSVIKAHSTDTLKGSSKLDSRSASTDSAYFRE